MTDSQTNSSYNGEFRLEVQDFGPIVSASVDLRPLTVFIGPSNTGKSYLAILIYALHRFFSSAHNVRFLRAKPSKLSQKTLEAVEKVQEASSANWEEARLVLPDLIIDEIRSSLDSQGDQLGNEISRCFGIDEMSALIRKGISNDTRVALRKKPSPDSTPFEHRLTLRPKEAAFRTSIPPGLSIPIDGDKDDWWMGRWRSIVGGDAHARRNDREREFLALELLETLASESLPQLSGPLCLPAFYLPADRTGVMHAHSVVVSAMIGSAPMTGLRPASGPPMLSGVLADFLRQLIELDRPLYWPARLRHRFHRGPRSGLDKQIEEALLEGEIRVDRSETVDYPHFTYQPKGWKDPLSLMRASSMVSELAPVVLYLRYLVAPGSVLIIEEPESHLHPAMQVEFTRQIAALVSKGVRVMLTTHSEWVLEELANIVRRSELPEADRKGLPRGEFALRSDQVGAWLFTPKRRPKGSVVKEIRLDDSGLYPSEYAEVANALHNDWAEISSLMGESE